MSLNYAAIVKLHDQVSGPAKQAGAAVQRMSGQIVAAQQKIGMMQRMKNGLTAVAEVAAKVSAVTGVAATAAAANATRISASYEDLGASLESVSSAATEAGKQLDAKANLDYITKFAAKTPYQMEQVATAFMQVKGAGLDPLSDGFRSLGDAASALNKPFDAASQMITDAIMGENERLKEFLVNASTKSGIITYNYMDKFGKQMTKTATKGDQAGIAKTIYSIMEEKFGGAMEKRSKTFNGLLSNVKDTASMLQRQFMSGGLFQAMKNNLEGKLKFMEALAESGAVVRWGEKSASVLQLVSGSMSKISSTIASANQRLSEFVGGWGNLAAALGLPNISKLFSAGSQKSGLPDWLKGTQASTALSPIIEQLRIIKKGDSLWNIAKQTSGIGSKYTEIAALNREIIKDADKIFPGQQIRIPKLSGLPDWAKARSIASTEQSPVSAPSVAPIVAIAELAKTNKVLAAAILVRQAWDQATTYLKGKFAELKQAAGLAFTKVLDWAVANRDTIKTAMRVIAVATTGGMYTAFRVGSRAVKTFGNVFTITMERLKNRLPELKAKVKTVMDSIGAWFDKNGEKIKTALSDVALKVLERFSAALEWLNEKAKDGSLGRWLDETYAKIKPVTEKIMEFGTGIWESVKFIGRFITKMAEMVGGWENMGKIFVALALVSTFSGLLGGLAAIAQIAAIAASGLLWLGSVLGINAVIGKGVAAVLGTVWRAFKLVGFAAALAGRMLMMNPIGLTIAAIAAAAYLLYINWDKVTAYFRNTSWSQMLIDALNLVETVAFFPFKTAIDALGKIWEWAKGLLQDTTWGSGIISTVESVIAGFERLKAAYTAVKEWMAGGITTTITAIQTGGASIKSGEGILGKAKEAGERIFGKADGTRALGGPVSKGRMYEIAERAPEIVEQGNRAYLYAKQAGKVVNLQQYRAERETKHTRIPSPQASMGRVVTEMRGLHELTVNLRTAPGTTASVEQKRTQGHVSKFNLGKQGGAAL
jgi:nucleoid-associated protein YgaU